MFTVIIPSVCKGSLQYAVDSVINQSYPYWDLIIAGDGVFVPPFDDERILTIIAPHKRDASATRMYAAKYAKGDYIAFLDDDDWLDPHHLEWMLPHTRVFGKDADIIISQMDNYGNIIPKNHVIEHGSVGISFAVDRKFLLANPLPPAPSEDYVYLKQMELAGANIRFTDRCSYVVRRYLQDGS